ncbi:MAG: FGGY family carbohydrate kinase [Chloroflexota bacterium]
MDDRLVLGIDVGSSSAKGVLATADGRIIHRAAIPQTVDRPGLGHVEQSPDQWWEALRRLVRSTIGRSAGAEARPLAGLAISGHFPTLVLADGDGEPIVPALLYADRRADGYVAQASEIAGWHLMGDELLPKLLWLRARRPDLLRRTRRVFNPQDHLVFRLTGNHLLDHRTAMRSGGLFDPAALAWRLDVANDLGLAPDALPELRRAGDIAGTVTSLAAADLGLPPGTPVILGLPDTPAALLGAGVVHPGDVLVYYGTTTTVDVCTVAFEDYLLDPSSIREWGPYREVGYAVLGPALPWAASGLRSVASRSGPDADLARLDRDAVMLGADPDGPYVLPHFMAHPRGDEPALRPAIVGLDVTHDRAHLHRALLESFGFTVRAGLEDADLTAFARNFTAAGGGAASDAWRQIVSDVLGVEQVWAAASDGALGDAMLAAWATCGSDVFGPGRSTWLGDLARTSPDDAASRVEASRYTTWCRLRDALTEVWRGPR